MSFQTRTRHLFLAGATLAAVAGCRTSMENFPDRSAEIQQLDQQRTQAKSDQLDMLAPREYEKMSDALNNAKERVDNRKDASSEVNRSQEALAELQQKAEPSRAILADVLSARQLALNAGANKTSEKEFKDVDSDLMKATREAANGYIDSVQKSRESLRNRYLNLEAAAIVDKNIGSAQRKLEALRKDDADDEAPKTFQRVKNKIADSERAIRADRNNSALIASNVAVANSEIARLEQVSKDAKRLDSEESAIELYDRDQQARAERERLEGLNQQLNSQVGQLSGTVGAMSAAEQQKAAELERTQQSLAATKAQADAARALEQRFTAAKQMFDSNEADVYKDGNNLLIRLKTLNFQKGKAAIPGASTAILGKVENVIKEFDGAEVRIEGHTDSTGSREINSRLSQERADAVKNYLVSKNTVPAEDIAAQGYGFEKPIASNKTADGRTQNRRVDIVIAPTDLTTAPEAPAATSGQK